MSAWQAIREDGAAEGAQRPFVVVRANGAECLTGQGGRMRRFGSLEAAAAAADEANRAGL